jgi:hypothetical protein
MTKRSKILITKRARRPLEISIGEAEDWEGFDMLIQYMENTFHVTVIDAIDGPGARLWTLADDSGVQFELVHDDGYGNYLLAPTPESEEIIMKIGRDIDARLSTPD